MTRDGLTAAEVEDRVRRGLVNEVPPAPSRTVTEILRANVLTRFNALIGLLVVIVLASGSPQDALFGGRGVQPGQQQAKQETAGEKSFEHDG